MVSVAFNDHHSLIRTTLIFYLSIFQLSMDFFFNLLTEFPFAVHTLSSSFITVTWLLLAIILFTLGSALVGTDLGVKVADASSRNPSHPSDFRVKRLSKSLATKFQNELIDDSSDQHKLSPFERPL